jgi:hypothetical protein
MPDFVAQHIAANALTAQHERGFLGVVLRRSWYGSSEAEHSSTQGVAPQTRARH